MASDKKKAKLRKDDLRTFMRLLGFAKPYAWRLIVGSVCALVGGGSLLAMLGVAKGLLGFVMDIRPTDVAATAPSAGAAAAGAGSGAAKILGKVMSPEEIAALGGDGVSTLLAICGVLMLVIVLNSAATFASMYYLQWVGQRVVMDLRVRLFSHLQKLSMSFYNTSSGGDMISRAVADTQILQNAVTNVITDAVRQPITLLLVLGYVLYSEWQLAFVSVVLFPTVVVPIILIGRRLRRISREGQKCLADLTSIMKESLDGVMVVKAFGQEAREERRFAEQSHRFFRRMVSAAKARALNDPITHIIGGISGVCVLVYAMVVQKPLEECIVFALAIWAMYEPIKKIGRIFMEIQQSSGPADRIFEIIDAPVTVYDMPGAAPISAPLEDLEFRNVVFGYGGREVFSGLDLRIEAGSSLALVGPSGGGKTTLVGLLLRFFDPQSGMVLRNGRDLRSYTIESVRGNIGLVMQDTFLFNSTIAENIAYGRPDASREEIEHAAKMAHAHDFIMQKEDGYDTVVGERGVSLSGGQKQRLAIARALLRDPEVLILDEATSALDTESERHVQAAIDGLMGRMTIVVIAHRLSTIAKCDRVAVIADGGVAEYGTHAELLAADGIYANLHRSQFSV